MESKSILDWGRHLSNDAEWPTEAAIRYLTTSIRSVKLTYGQITRRLSLPQNLLLLSIMLESTGPFFRYQQTLLMEAVIQTWESTWIPQVEN
jgi:hypothetical protein